MSILRQVIANLCHNITFVGKRATSEPDTKFKVVLNSYLVVDSEKHVFHYFLPILVRKNDTQLHTNTPQRLYTTYYCGYRISNERQSRVLT